MLARQSHFYFFLAAHPRPSVASGCLSAFCSTTHLPSSTQPGFECRVRPHTGCCDRDEKKPTPQRHKKSERKNLFTLTVFAHLFHSFGYQWVLHSFTCIALSLCGYPLFSVTVLCKNHPFLHSYILWFALLPVLLVMSKASGL